MRNRTHIHRGALACAIGAALFTVAAQAQDASAQTAQPAAAPAKAQSPNAGDAPTRELDQIVVTGNANAGGIKKIEASYSVTTANLEKIKEANPVSVADLLKISPGIFAESSGGQTGANIEVAGFPSDSGAPFTTFAVNGAPLFPRWDYFTDAMLRLDDTIDRLEALQGGPSVLYGNGQPGVIANFILREGTSTPSGSVGLTYGSEGSWRFDGFYGFPIAEGWYGSVGGFWRKSDGVRDPQYPADDGGQLTATLRHDLDHGSVLVFARLLKDKNQFVTDTPIYNPAPGKFSPYPNFDPLTGTFGSKSDRYQFLEDKPCFTAGCTPGGVDIDMANGEGGNLHLVGANLDLDFENGWSLSDKFLLLGGNMDINSFFSTGANPQTLGSFISDSANAFGLPSGLTATATYRNGGTADMNENISVQNPEYIHKRINSISNEIHLSRELFEGNTLTLGNYTARYSIAHSEDDGLNMLLQAKSNPNPIVVSLSDGTHTYQLTDKQGLFWNNDPQSWMTFNEYWRASTTAFFFSDVWNIGNWRFDGGMRVQHNNTSGWYQNGTTGDLDANPYTVYNNNAFYVTDDYLHPSYSKTASSWTLGANYLVNDNMSAYARANRGVFFPGFDSIVYVPDVPVERIRNFEVGFKYQAPWIYADIAAYQRKFTGIPYSITLDTGQINLLYGSSTKGLNAQVVLTPIENLSLAFSGNYMDGHYSDYQGCVPYTAQDGSDRCDSITGKPLDRQPKVQYRFTPAYTIPTDWGSLKLWTTYEYVGNRYGDQLSMQPLGHYYDLAIGAMANVGKNWVLTLRGTNVTNQIGITEGNARLFGFASGGGVILARSIEGRELNFQVKYKF
ncbi:MAG: TonB-dependent receptor [Rudaea sp.]|uniref:TonB-dependent receptor n=1 Tax=Rudaea sp. TaxID=2136325 RepID=UPI0039E65C17